jgi:DNA processing protein
VDEQNFIEQNGIYMINPKDPKYPTLIHKVRKKLPTIYHMGELLEYDDGIAVVGTRKCSENGQLFAHNIGKLLSENNYKVVSGLATGIDAFAHSGCLENNGLTIAILAWFHELSPKSNKELFEKIIETGCALSENVFAPTKEPKYAFLKRDDIIAALSNAVVVVETKSKGGAKYTANIARKKNIPVIVPKISNNDAELQEGFEVLKQEGAHVAKDEDHVIEIIKSLPKQKKIFS